MNITSMVRGMIGEAKPGDVRALELKQGQVVRGVVLQAEEGSQEAVVQINGVPVKAVLESPLKPGQSMLLQVQGQQQDGMILLKPTGENRSQASLSVADAIKMSGLPDEPWVRSLFAELKRSGVDITPEVVAKLTKAMTMVPAGKSLEEWMQTAMVALKRQLPLTAESLRGLQQIMHGKPLHQLLQQFLQATKSAQALMPSPSNGGIGTTSTNAQAIVQSPMQQAQQLIQTLLSAMPSAVGDSSVESMSALRQPGTALAAGQVPREAVSQPMGKQENLSQPLLSSTGGNQAEGQRTSLSASSSPLQNLNATKDSGVLGTESINRPLASSAEDTMQASNTQQKGSLETAASQTTRGQGQAISGEHASSWVGKLLQALGVNHEHQVRIEIVKSFPSQATTTAAHGEARADADASGARSIGANQTSVQASQSTITRIPEPLHQQASMPPNAVNSLQTAMNSTSPEQGVETIKSTLLQLLQSDALPSSVREAAQSIVSHITGQQLLLSSDRSLPFAHISLFVPLVTPDGEQTAAVHIQARQGKKGELDAANCRLWFDLDLRALGRTVVDVNVVEKMVALNIHHADENVRNWLEPYREEIDGALGQIGYQLSAFRTMPIDEESAQSPVKQALDDYTLAPYKGVDVRI
ncbi:DNA ligase [Paenibacillus sp. 1001270B_150601_E10]|uniref:DNA ligase n=1 Tax=Paenibacillus sp. 1001270B_150601_E10 TaxID=2787079 RepID=UPI00189E4538|nr:DNA ligase [Paenibacillus sp. 1001270B_150601_E10]